MLRAAPRPKDGGGTGSGIDTNAQPGFASYPGGFLRVTVPVSAARSAPEVRLGTITKRATRSDGGWSAFFAIPPQAGSAPLRQTLELRAGSAAASAAASVTPLTLRRASPADSFALASDDGRARAWVPAEALFEDAVLIASAFRATASGELVPAGESWQLGPARMPLRRAVTVSLALEPASSGRGSGVYRWGDDGWEWVGASVDSASGRIAGDSRRLGRFAVFRDATAPRATLQAPPRRFTSKPYSRWALEAQVTENGSGVNARATWFEIDGKRVPTEWDSETGVLRWRPAQPPKPGAHKVRIVVTDRAGNTRSVDASFTRS